MHITAFAGVAYLPKATQITEFASTLRVCQSLHTRAVVPKEIHRYIPVMVALKFTYFYLNILIKIFTVFLQLATYLFPITVRIST